jgi:hypothetical protein
MTARLIAVIATRMIRAILGPLQVKIDLFRGEDGTVHLLASNGTRLASMRNLLL